MASMGVPITRTWNHGGVHIGSDRPYGGSRRGHGARLFDLARVVLVVVAADHHQPYISLFLGCACRHARFVVSTEILEPQISLVRDPKLTIYS